MTRIVLVGAGSVEFTRNLLGDFLSYPELRDAELVLHDIDEERLATAMRMAHWSAEALGATPSIRGELDRRAALRDADFVIDTIQVGGARATHIDFDIPARYGLQYTINDTINVGGVLRGLRTIPVVLAIVRDIEEVCPDAIVPELHEPDVDARPGGRREQHDPHGRALPFGVLDGPGARGVRRRSVAGGRSRDRWHQPPRLRAADRPPRS